jgi:hypothetical protein
MNVDALVQSFAAHETQTGAVRPAERGDRLGELDRLTDRRLQVDLMVIGQAEQLVIAFLASHNHVARMKVDRG